LKTGQKDAWPIECQSEHARQTMPVGRRIHLIATFFISEGIES